MKSNGPDETVFLGRPYISLKLVATFKLKKRSIRLYVYSFMVIFSLWAMHSCNPYCENILCTNCNFVSTREPCSWYHTPCYILAGWTWKLKANCKRRPRISMCHFTHLERYILTASSDLHTLRLMCYMYLLRFRLWLLWPLLGWSMFRTVTPSWQGCCKTAWEATAKPHLLPPSPLLLPVMQRPLIHWSLPKGITIYDGRYTCVVHCAVNRVSSGATQEEAQCSEQACEHG